MKSLNWGFLRMMTKHCEVLNRPIDFTVDGDGLVVSCEPDPRHVELLLEHLELDGTKGQGRERTR